MPTPQATTTNPLSRVVTSLAQTETSDSELLGRFIETRDPDAFATLVTRHKTLVWGVCRRIVGDHHDAEDAFQATFLVLSRKAATVRPRELLPNWLHGVARQTARKARAIADRRRAREKQVSDMPERLATVPSVMCPDLERIIDEVLGRLPEKYRAVLVLCDLDGQTRSEAARRLNVPEGTVAGRLSRARAMLVARLTRRGITLPAGALVSALPLAAADPPAALVSATVGFGGAFATGSPLDTTVISPNVAALTTGVLKRMLFLKLAMASAVLFLSVALAAVAVACALPAAPSIPPTADQPRPAAPQPRTVEKLAEGATARLGTVRFRHSPRVDVVAYAPDGKMIASFGADEAVRFWHPTDGTELRRVPLKLHPLWIIGPCAMAFANDGSLVAVSAHRSVALIPVGTGEPRYLIEQEDDVTGLAFSPDDKLLAVFGKGQFVSLVNPTTGKEKHKFTATQRDVVSAVFTPDGKELIAGCSDNTVRFWTIADGKIVRTIKTGDRTPFNLALSPDGKRLAWGDDNGRLHVHDLTTDKETDSFAVADGAPYNAPPIGTLRFTPKGTLEAWGTAPPTLCVWEPNKPVHRRVFDHLPSKAPYGRLAPDSKRAICWAETSPALRVLNIETGREEEVAPGHWRAANSLAMSADGHTIASGSGDDTIRLFDLRTGREIRRWEPHRGHTPHIAFASDGKVLASCSWDGEKSRQGTIRLWNPATGREVRKWETEANSRVMFAAEGKVLFAAGHTRVEVWNPDEGKLIREMEEVPEAKKPPRQIDEFAPRLYWSFYDLAVPPDGKVVAAMIAQGGGSDRVYLWDATTGKRLAGWEKKGLLAPLAFSPDGKTLAARKQRKPDTMDYDVVLWDVATGKEQTRFPLTEQLCGSLAFSPDGKLLAVGDKFHGEIHVWRVADAKRVAHFKGPEGEVVVTFAADDTLISAGADTTLLVWDLRQVRAPNRK
jgi:RNA polymerase sigma factor (sigma-70 family)